MAVTRPQTQAGIIEAWITDLAEAVSYAHEQHAAGKRAKSSAIYGGVAEGWTEEADGFIQTIMGTMMDRHQSLPPL
jgi:sphinganine-1-phosphate aldolase